MACEASHAWLYCISMKLSYKYRLYPNQEQAAKLQQQLCFCVSYIIALWKSARASIRNMVKAYLMLGSAKHCQRSKKSSRSKLILYSQSLQQVLKRLDAAIKTFSVGSRGKPTKSVFLASSPSIVFDRFLFPQSDLKSGGVKLLDNNKLRIFGIPGELKVKWHRPFQGRCKQVAIVKHADKYYLVLSCDEVPLAPLAKTGKTIGIDLGLTYFITGDDGSKFHHPKPYRTSKEKLAYHNRKLAVKQKGSQ